MPLHRRSVARPARSEAPGEQLLGTKRKVGRVHLASLICCCVKASVVWPMIGLEAGKTPEALKSHV